MGRYKCSLLIIDDDPAIISMIRAVLWNDYDLHFCESAEEGQKYLLQNVAEMIITDQELRGIQGISFLEWVRDQYPRSVRILMTGLHSLDQAVDAINSGLAQRFLFKPFRPQQLVLILRNASRAFLLERSHEQLLDELRRLNQELEKRVAERTSELEIANKQLGQRNQMLQRMALTDALTSLPNRRVMERLAKNELLRRTRNPSPLAVAIIDIDFFKSINTRYLHSGGDHVLIWFGQVLVNSVRTIDTVGRIGGEEFMVVAPDTDLEGAEILAERIRKKIEDAETIYQNEKIKVTASIGMVVADTNISFTYKDLHMQISKALQTAKTTGRNRCIVCPIIDAETPVQP